MDVLHVFIKHSRAAHRSGIRIEMNKVKDAERDDAGHLMQLAKDKGLAKTN